jgi:hypothetical protein
MLSKKDVHRCASALFLAMLGGAKMRVERAAAPSRTTDDPETIHKTASGKLSTAEYQKRPSFMPRCVRQLATMRMLVVLH